MFQGEDLYIDLEDNSDDQDTEFDPDATVEISFDTSPQMQDRSTKKNALSHFLSNSSENSAMTTYQKSSSGHLRVSIPRSISFKDSSLQFMNMKITQDTINSFSNNSLVKMTLTDFSSTTDPFLKPLKIHVPIVTNLSELKFNAVIDYSNCAGSEDMVMRDMTVARFGRIYKRKAPSKMGYKCIAQIEGYRYCKFCNANLPLSAFYVTQKRYVCRRHHYLRVTLRDKVVSETNVHFRLARQSWIKLDTSKFLLGYDKLRYDIGDILQIFKHLSEIKPIEKIEPVCVPRDYSLPMRPANVAVISTVAFYLILKFLDFMPCRPFYVAFVQRVNLVPKNFDVGNPENPYHDPSYERKEYDLGTLFSDFEALNLPIETKDNDVLQELVHKNKVPWRDCEELPPGEAGSWRDGKPVCSQNTKRKRARIEVLDDKDME